MDRKRKNMMWDEKSDPMKQIDRQIDRQNIERKTKTGRQKDCKSVDIID